MSILSHLTRNVPCPTCGEKSKRLRTWKPEVEAEHASVYYHYRQCKACGEKFGVRFSIERQIMPLTTVDAIRKRYGGVEPTPEQLAAFWLDEDSDE